MAIINKNGNIEILEKIDIWPVWPNVPRGHTKEHNYFKW